MAAGGKRQRLSQEVRRAEVIDAALIEFGRRGYDGASTGSIARRAGVKQPYIYALFEDKRDLFLSCFESLNSRMLERFREVAVAADSPDDRLRAMGNAYLELLEDDEKAVCHLQIFAAGGHEELREPIRRGFEATFAEIARVSGGSQPEVARFFATGMFLNALTAIGMGEDLVDDLRVPKD